MTSAIRTPGGGGGGGGGDPLAGGGIKPGLAGSSGVIKEILKNFAVTAGNVYVRGMFEGPGISKTGLNCLPSSEASSILFFPGP